VLTSAGDITGEFIAVLDLAAISFVGSALCAAALGLSEIGLLPGGITSPWSVVRTGVPVSE